jgi:hypothetical protein
MQHDEISLYQSLRNEVSIIEYADGHLIINSQQSTAKNVQKIGAKINELTGHHWNVSINDNRDGIIYGINHKLKLEQHNKELLNHQLVRKITEIFPELEIDDIKTN